MLVGSRGSGTAGALQAVVLSISSNSLSTHTHIPSLSPAQILSLSLSLPLFFLQVNTAMKMQIFSHQPLSSDWKFKMSMDIKSREICKV